MNFDQKLTGFLSIPGDICINVELICYNLTENCMNLNRKWIFLLLLTICVL